VRDSVLGKYTEVAKANFSDLHLNDMQQQRIYNHGVPAVLYWFLCEEIMKSSSPLIIEYGFHNDMKAEIRDLIGRYEYQTINIHFDASAEITCRRFNERNSTNFGVAGKIPLDVFVKALEQDGRVKDSRDFRYGDCVIDVDTTDFSVVSYQKIAEQVLSYKDQGAIIANDF